VQRKQMTTSQGRHGPDVGRQAGVRFSGLEGRKLMRKNASGAFMAEGRTTGASAATSGVAMAAGAGARMLLMMCKPQMHDSLERLP
jgi:hypothetical protein